MKKHVSTMTGMVAMVVLLASCGSMQPVSQVRDDIYFRPSDAPATASTNGRNDRMRPDRPEEMEVVEDYFDQNTSKQLGTSGNYYDMAYNDPFYYNQGRFGFGMGMGGMGMGGMGMGMGGMGMGMGMMGWQSGWAGPGWGMGMGWGMGPSMGMGMGWGSPFGWYDPWCPWNPWSPWNRPMGMGWNRPWGWHNPWMMGGGWGMGGWGMGNYWGPWGNCWNCYMPIVVGGSSNTFVGHRPSMGSGGGTGGGSRSTFQPRMPLRDPVSLDPVRREVAREPYRPVQRNVAAPSAPGRSVPQARPQPDQRIQQPSLGRDQHRSMPHDRRANPQQDRRMSPQQERRMAPQQERRTAPQQERSAPRQHSAPQQRNFDRGGSFDRGRSPSFSPGGGGGGSRPSAPRPR